MGEGRKIMNILFTGNITRLSAQFFETVAGLDNKENLLILYNEESDEREKQDKKIKENLDRIRGLSFVRVFDSGKGKSLETLFKSYSFGMIVYFSKALDGAKRFYDELEDLEENLHLAKKYNVPLFTQVVTNDIYREVKDADIRFRNRRMLLMTGERMGYISASTDDIKVVTLRVPRLYSDKENDWEFSSWVDEAILNEKIVFSGGRLEDTDFLNDQDLGELIERIADLPPKADYTEMDLSGGNVCNLEIIYENFQKVQPDVNVFYKNDIVIQPIIKSSEVARTEYGWYPKHNLWKELPVIYEKRYEDIKKNNIKKEKKEKLRKFGEATRVGFEILSLAFIAEWLNRRVSGNAVLGFIDFRMVAVTIIGSMNGLMPGLLSASLASIGYLIMSHKTLSWQILLLNVMNWLPFVSYFLLGAVSGYGKDKHEDEKREAKQERRVLEKKYEFLNKTYEDVLKSAEQYNSQIIGYTESYGKIYGAIQKLDSMKPEEVYFEGIQVLEKLLENNSIAIYNVYEDNIFARLVVCSKQENGNLSKSFDLRAFPQMTEKILKGESFINSKCLPDYPAYCCPIMEGDTLRAMVQIIHAKDSQMNNEFHNKLFIISRLISASIARAVSEQEREDRFIEGTHVLSKDKFCETLEIYKQMSLKNFMDYTLIRLIPVRPEVDIHDPGNIKAVETGLQGVIRNNDILGIGSDDAIWLLLLQTGKAGANVVKERLAEREFVFEDVK